MTQHTPEPWKILDYHQRDIGASHNCTVARVLNPPVGHSDANARRIVACVNACAGMSDDELAEFSDGSLKNWIDDADETLKAVCDAVEDVDYSGRCEKGIYSLKQQRNELKTAWANAAADLAIMKLERDELLAAGNRVITRFDARLDEERESILHAIYALREAIAKASAKPKTITEEQLARLGVIKAQGDV